MSALREIRERRGMSQPALARLAGTSQQQIDRLEKGQRGLTLAWARRLAPLLGVAPRELQPAEGYDDVPILGHVGADETVVLDVAATDPALAPERETADAPPGEPDLAALRVRGDGLSPRYLDGELIFYSRLAGRDPARFLPGDCVVRLADGRLLVKRVERSGDGASYTLRSYNPIAALIVNCQVEWLAPILWRASRRQETPSERS